MRNLEINVTFYNFEELKKCCIYYETTIDKVASDIKGIILKHYDFFGVLPNENDCIKTLAFEGIGLFKIKDKTLSLINICFDIDFIEYD